LTDPRSWAKRWNDASLGRILALPDRPSRRWPLVGTFAIGLFVGAVGTYVVTQRSQIKRLGRRALAFKSDLLGELGTIEAAKPVSVTSHRSNHRRKAAAEVT
jgi:hypothetical protein